MINSFNEYQKEAMKTAVYPNIGNNLAYPVLGLINEFGELLTANNDDKVLEVSDIYWYLAACYYESGIEYGGFTICNDDVFLTMAKMAGIAKKAMRDNGGVIQEEKKDDFRKALRVVNGKLHKISHQLGGTPLEIMQINLDKLADRQSRNVIKGDGDYR